MNFQISLGYWSEKSLDHVCITHESYGDTGKAALEGFADVEGTKIIVFYPEDGVSDVQKMQMVTQKEIGRASCRERV